MEAVHIFISAMLVFTPQHWIHQRPVCFLASRPRSTIDKTILAKLLFENAV
jgi:hypothetical protein